MFNLFSSNRNDDERDDGRPRIIFANLHSPNRPILTEAGYRVFSATAFSGWALVVFIAWIFHIEISLSKDLVTSIAGSSVELSALSLAVLGILHELNKKDKWFKLGLLLVAILFIDVVFYGFFLALTWQPIFDLPQQITIVATAAFGAVAALQIDWKVALRLVHVRWWIIGIMPRKVRATIRRVRLTIPFVLPIVLVWLPGLNRVTAVVVLFVGALIVLSTLMAVTTLSLLNTKEEAEPEDPFITTLRVRYENEIELLIRFGELKARTIDALHGLQKDKVRVSIEQRYGRQQAPDMIEMAYVVNRLRRMGIAEEERALKSVLDSLVDEKIVCRKNHSGPFWTLPEVDDGFAHLEKLALVISIVEYKKGYGPDSLCSVEDYSFRVLRDWLANKMQIPTFVACEYIVPVILGRLLSKENFHHIVRESGSRIHIFVNKKWKNSQFDWKAEMDRAKAKAEEQWEQEKSKRYDNSPEHAETAKILDSIRKPEFIEQKVRFNLLMELPHTREVEDITMRSDEFDTLKSILME